MFCVLLLCLATFSDDAPYVLWLKNNKHMNVQAAPTCEKARCRVTLMNGQVTSLPADLIDMARSETYNREAAAKREEARLARETAAAEQAALEAKEAAKNKERRVVLTADDKLPKYDRSAAQTTGSVAADAPSDDQVGEPRVTNFSSDQPVHVAREVLTKYKDRYDLACDVRVAGVDNVSKVIVRLRINFDKVPPRSLSQTLTSPMRRGDTATLHFTVPETDDILRVSYEVEATTVETRIE